MQVKVGCEKIKAQTTANKKYISNMLNEIADHYQEKLMAKEWEPKEEHQAVIARSIEFISDELAELQEALRCPNSFIVEIANRVVSEYKTNQIIIRRDEE